jgi:hypothetical protein
MAVRVCAIALAAAMMAGCTSGYGGGYDDYPGESYYDDPYYGGGFGYGSYYDDYDHYDRYFHPADNVSCDRKRDICYDRFGPSYYATARYLGESEANQAYKKYGDSVFLFSPRPGVSCDRRTKECSDGQWTNRAAPDPLKRIERGNMGSIGAGSGFDDDDQLVRPTAPARRNSDDNDAMTKRVKPEVDATPPPMADNDDDIVRPSRRIQTQQPEARPRLNSCDKVQDGGAGNACPPRGCTD